MFYRPEQSFTFWSVKSALLIGPLQTFTTRRVYYTWAVRKISVQKHNHRGFYTLVCIFRIWFERTLQRWRHKSVFINPWRWTLRRRLIFHTNITFNQFYCFAKFQSDDVIILYFTDQNSFKGLWSVKSVSFVEKKHRSEILSFSPRPANFNSKKIITAATVSLSVFDCMWHQRFVLTNLVLNAINFFISF